MYTHLFEYLGEDGAPVTGWHTIDNKRYYFQSDGLRAQNDVVTIDGKKYLFDYDGQLVKNTYGIVERPSMFFSSKTTYHTDADGVIQTGRQLIDGKEYIFSENGVVLNGIITFENKDYFVINSVVQKNSLKAYFAPVVYNNEGIFNGIYGTDENGIVLKGFQRGIDGQLHYFQPEVKSVTKPSWEEINGQRYRLTDGDYVEPTAGMRPTIIVSNTTLKVDDKVYSFDDKGISTEVTPKKSVYSRRLLELVLLRQRWETPNRSSNH